MTNMFKVLTFTLALTASFASDAQVIMAEKSDQYLRWNIFAPKDLVIVTQNGRDVRIKTLDVELFEKMSQDLTKLKANNKFIESFRALGPDNENNVSSIKVTLSSSDVEVFNFYRSQDKKHVVDFWIDQKVIKPQKKTIQQAQKSPSKPAVSAPKASMVKKTKKVNKKVIQKQPIERFSQVTRPAWLRDFRYGASFVWDLEPILPLFKAYINLERKTPEYFYPIENRKFTKDDREAHLQLAINMYRKKKWGLMYKSLTLYQQRYGEETDVDIIEYLKANALLRDNFEKGNTEPVKMAIGMYRNIVQRSKNYELRKAIYKYLVTYSMEQKEYVEALKQAKLFFVDARENYDYEELNKISEIVLNNLGHLQQIDQIKEFLSDKTISKFISKQDVITYEIYALVRMNRSEEAIKLFEKHQKGFQPPLAASLLFNMGEAYFRQAQYNKAVQLFDDLISQYSYLIHAERARLRIALAYDIMEKDYKKVKNLYLNAINRSVDFQTSYEAKMRLVALTNLRNKKRSKQDKETIIFLNLPEKKTLENEDMKRQLWLVRLRLLIVDKEYNKALSYLNAIPLKSMSKADRRVFESDGAEIIYGLIRESFEEKKYAKVLQIWNLYKDIYVDKVSLDPLTNFMVGSSQIALGFWDSFDETYKSFDKLKFSKARTYPLWVERPAFEDDEKLLAHELNVKRWMKKGEWIKAAQTIKKLETLRPEYAKVNYYKGNIYFSQKQYKEASKSFEDFLVNKSSEKLIDKDELATLMHQYTETLYQLGDIPKFKASARAFIKDTENNNEHTYLKKVRERTAYLLIELLAGEGTPEAYLELEQKINEFEQSFKGNTYGGRLQYLKGKALVENKKLEQGQEILETLIRSENIDEHVKELAKTELSMLKIKQKSL